MEILLTLEGGGTRSQAAVLDENGHLLGEGTSTEVNTNFVPLAQAQSAARSAVLSALRSAGMEGSAVKYFAIGLVGPCFGAETFGDLLPQARYRYYKEWEIIFARAGLYQPHGVAVAAATGATAFGVRSDDGRQAIAGGWGSLLGDEGSAYAVGLQALRGAARAFEGRLDLSTRIVEAVCAHFGLEQADFRNELIRLAYQKPLSRAEIAGLAPLVTRLAQKGDALARRIMEKTAKDLAGLALFTARKLFSAHEAFNVVAAGGLINAGELALGELRLRLAEEFPKARLLIGNEPPAVALGRLALVEIANNLDR